MYEKHTTLSGTFLYRRSSQAILIKSFTKSFRSPTDLQLPDAKYMLTMNITTFKTHWIAKARFHYTILYTIILSLPSHKHNLN